MVIPVEDKMTCETCTADHMVHILPLCFYILHVSNQKGEQGLEMKPTADARQHLGMRLWYDKKLLPASRMWRSLSDFFAATLSAPRIISIPTAWRPASDMAGNCIGN